MFDDILDKLMSEAVIPVIELLFVFALVIFLWGVVQFIINQTNLAGRQQGKDHMIYGAIGLAIMLSAFGIVNFVFNTVTDDGATTGLDGKPIEKPEIIEKGSF